MTERYIIPIKSRIYNPVTKNFYLFAISWRNPMAESRLRDPIHNLEQTAYDLAYYIRHVNQTEFLAIVSEVRKEYGAPKDSWFWSWFYSRNRVATLDTAIKELQPKTTVTEDKTVPPAESAQDVDAKTKSIDAVKKLLNEGGWEDSSANTKLLEQLIKKLHRYNPNFILIERERIILKELLIIAIDQRLKVEEQMNNEELKLKQINDDKIRKEKELLQMQADLLRKQEEVIESENKLRDLSDKKQANDIDFIKAEKEHQARLAEFQEKLKLIEVQKIEREGVINDLDKLKEAKESELESARQKLLLLNPEFDIKKLSLTEVEAIMREAKKVGEAAVWTYLKERDEIQRKKKELDEMRGQLLSKAKTALAGKNLNGMIATGPMSKEQEEQLKKEEEERKRELAKLETEKELRRKKVEEECSVREKKNDEGIRSFLQRHFSIQAELNQNKEARERAKSIDRGSLKTLYTEGSRAQINDEKAMGNLRVEIKDDYNPSMTSGVSEQNTSSQSAQTQKGELSSAVSVDTQQTLTTTVRQPEGDSRKKQRISFKDMKLRAPASDNKEFMSRFQQVSALIKPKDVPPSSAPSTTQDDTDVKPKIDNARKLLLEKKLRPGLSAAVVNTTSDSEQKSTAETKGVDPEEGAIEVSSMLLAPPTPPPPPRWIISKASSEQPGPDLVSALVQFSDMYAPETRRDLASEGKAIQQEEPLFVSKLNSC